MQDGIINEELLKNYGTLEVNPVPEGYHEQERDWMDWKDLKPGDHIELERMRLVTDPGYPFYDVSYVDMIVNGQKYHIENFPLSRLSRREYKKELYKLAKDKGIFIKDLFRSISILF